MSLSPWFSLVEHEYPEHEGVYQVQDATGIMLFSYWNGTYFGYPSRHILSAEVLKYDYAGDWYILTKWRGSIREV